MPERVRLESGYRVYEEYRDDIDPRLAKNPMAMAMPTLADVAEAAKALTRFPDKRPADFLTWPVEERVAELNKLSQLNIPEEMGVAVMFRVVALSRNSYAPRDPVRPEIQQAILEAAKGNDVLVNPIDGSAAGMVLTGCSGLGKTALVKCIKLLFGQELRIHLSLKGEPCRWRQLTAVCIVVQTRWRATLVAILNEIDRQTRRGVLRGGKRRGSIPELLLQVMAALSGGFPPILILDEFQKLGRLSKEEAEEILDGLTEIMEMTGIPILIVGTAAVGQLFNRYAMHMTKFEDANKFTMQPMRLEDESCKNLIQAYKFLSVSTTEIVYSEDFDTWLMAHTMGVKRFMRFAMKAVLSRHARDETIVANKELLESIAQMEMSSCQQALSVLRRVALGFSTSLAEQDNYEHFYSEMERERQSPASVTAQTQWEQKRLKSRNDIMTAEDYLLFKARLSDDGLRLVADDEKEALAETERAHKTMKSFEHGAKNKAKRKKTEQANLDKLVATALKAQQKVTAIDPGELPE